MIRIAFVINPRSGAGEGLRATAVARALIDRSVYAGAVLDPTATPIESILDEAKAATYVVVGGGDGTVSRFLAAAAEVTAPIAIAPLGTANDLAREIGAVRHYRQLGPESYFRALEIAAPREHQLWNLHTDDRAWVFSNYFSLGLDAAVVSRFHQLRDRPRAAFWRSSRAMKILANRIDYARAAIELRSFRLRGLALTAGSTRTDIEPCATLLFANIRAYLGLGVSTRSADGSSATLEALTLRFISSYAGTLLPEKARIIGPRRIASGSQFCVQGPLSGMGAQLDGEYVELGDCESVRISPAHRVRLLAFRP